jgi:hypothetical protein
MKVDILEGYRSLNEGCPAANAMQTWNDYFACEVTGATGRQGKGDARAGSSRRRCDASMNADSIYRAFSEEEESNGLEEYCERPRCVSSAA